MTSRSLRCLKSMSVTALPSHRPGCCFLITNPILPMLAFSDDPTFTPPGMGLIRNHTAKRSADGNQVGGMVLLCIGRMTSLPSCCLPPARGCRFSPKQPLPRPSQNCLERRIAYASVFGALASCAYKSRGAMPPFHAISGNKAMAIQDGFFPEGPRDGCDGTDARGCGPGNGRCPAAIEDTKAAPKNAARTQWKTPQRSDSAHWVGLCVIVLFIIPLPINIQPVALSFGGLKHTARLDGFGGLRILHLQELHPMITQGKIALQIGNPGQP